LVAQGGSLTAREHGGHPLAAAGQLAAPDGVDTAEDAVKAAAAQALLDRLARVAARKELRPRDEVVLRPRERPDR
jgi:hypothetical protein